jgi:DNA-binding transcriptional MerR regulator/quercetin dioxygenase-like cupin family protein
MRKADVYFTISEAAQLLGVSPSSLRNWEETGLLTPIRSQGRYRLYSRELLQTAKRIKYLRSIKRLNLAGIAHTLGTQAVNHRPPRSRRKKASGIGRQLARLRHQQRLTLTEVARKTGLSVSFLSSLERGQANASIATLQKLAHFYKTNVLSFFGGRETENRLVRPRDRRVLQPHPGVEMELLALGNTVMEPHLFRIAPGAGSGGSYHHEGEEFIHVLKGQLEIWLDEVERYVLEQGDSLYFESSQAHRWQNATDKKTVLLWINTPPTF